MPQLIASFEGPVIIGQRTMDGYHLFCKNCMNHLIKDVLDRPGVGMSHL